MSGGRIVFERNARLLNPPPRFPNLSRSNSCGRNAKASCQNRVPFMRRPYFANKAGRQNGGATLANSEVAHIVGMRPYPKMLYVDARAIIARMQNVLARLKAAAKRHFHGGPVRAQSLSPPKRHIAVAVAREASRPNAAITFFPRAGQDYRAKDCDLIVWRTIWFQDTSIKGGPSPFRGGAGVRNRFEPAPRVAGADRVDSPRRYTIGSGNCSVGIAASDLVPNVKNLGCRQPSFVMRAATAGQTAFARIFRILFVCTQTKVRDLYAMRHVAVMHHHHSGRYDAMHSLPKNASGNAGSSFPSDLRMAISGVDQCYPEATTIGARRAVGVYRANSAAVLRVSGARLVNAGAHLARFWPAVFDRPVFPHAHENGVIAGGRQ